ncbi:MAG: SDR family NAD(P)-dependent oxidoreductase [Gammaproteobacteria bacterium]
MSTARKMPAAAIAVVGMAGRFPNARNVAEFWQNLRAGIESLEKFTDEELAALGIDPRLLENPNYVKAGSVLGQAAEFDAAFFGVNPREAEVMDPQQRVFLECAWEAIEDAGYDTERLGVPVGVFAGTSMNTYIYANLLANPQTLAAVGAYQAMIGNDKDFLATRVSYKLNLRGPSLTVQTACSTSLVAVHLACESLLTHQCDMALAGGVSISFPQRAGYLYQEGMILSPDAKVRPFDAQGGGIRAGEGVGLVVLKRLEDALAAGDAIRAVILGTAINNDGAQKIGYTAPSVDGQAEAIATAQSIAEVDPATITYIEAHGTSTPLGDPIEVAALSKVFRAHTEARQFCGIGSVKGNIGHLDAAAGVAGLIKAVLALEHRELPPSLNYETPNPQIDFAASPFFVNSTLRPWAVASGAQRRAGVSSFGIGGTNAHAVLEEAPPVSESAGTDTEQLIVLSARSAAALAAARERLATFLGAHPLANLANVAFTLQTGRRVFDHRCMLVASSAETARKLLASADSRDVASVHVDNVRRSVAFMFSGQGSQYPQMGWDLYRTEPVFRAAIDACAAALTGELGVDLRTALFAEFAKERGAAPLTAEQLNETRLTQPALFAIEYATAKLWEHWGVTPQSMIGHSIGEYVAACLSGVFTLESALAVVATRGALMQKLEAGAMLSVQLDEAELSAHLAPGLAIAALNAPGLCVVSGATPAIDALESKFETMGVITRRLRTSHAFHSEMMQPAVAPFVASVARHKLGAPRIPFISNVTGTWITAEQATDPQYWGQHLRGAVRFADGVRALAREAGRLLIEVGPGNTLKSLAKQILPGTPEDSILASLPHAQERQASDAFVRRALGRVWLAGVPVQWASLHEARAPRRVSLPTYPFESRRFWVEPLRRDALVAAQSAIAPRRNDVTDWFWLPSWQRSSALGVQGSRSSKAANQRWLVFADDTQASVALLRELRVGGIDVVEVQRGDSFASPAANRFRIKPDRREDYDSLLEAVLSGGAKAHCVLHLWNAASPDTTAVNPERGRRDAFYSTLYLAQGLGDVSLEEPLPVLVVSTDMQRVLGTESLRVERSLLIGPVLVMSQDVPILRARSVDVAASEWEAGNAAALAGALLAEAALTTSENAVAYRSGYRWEQSSSPVRLAAPAEDAVPLRERGVYLITGGTGGLGLAIARHLAKSVRARLVLTARSGLPDRAQWPALLDSADADERIKSRIRSVQELEALGAEVFVAAADVADETQMAQVIAAAKARFGKLNGVLHAAGLPGLGVLPLKTREATEIVLRPKVEGTLILDRLLASADLDFLALFSTINTVFGWHGTSDYSSANAFLDSFAQAGVARCSRRVVAINWGTWREVGMAAAFAVARGDSDSDAMRAAISPDEGSEALRRVLASSITQVFVTPTPMPDLVSGIASLTRQIQASHLADAEEVRSHTSVRSSKTHHERPPLETQYVEPRNDEEKALAGMWSELLGIEPVGVDDNFFELGGHSLLATRVLSRMQDLFKVRLPMRAIFEAPTVAGLGERIRTALWSAESKVRAGAESTEAREEIEL